MKKLALLTVLLTLIGCGGPMIYQVSPGHPMPEGLAVCKSGDGVGRCTRWTNESEYCVNPDGPAAQPPLILCPKDENGKPMPFPESKPTKM